MKRKENILNYTYFLLEQKIRLVTGCKEWEVKNMEEPLKKHGLINHGIINIS